MNSVVEYTDDQALFDQLRAKQTVAWPTVAVLVVCLSVIAIVWVLCLNDQLALWQGCLINTVAMYYLFSPMHDSMHLSVFKNAKLNHLCLAATIFPISPFVSGQFLRMMHMQHHRFANSELDPDHVVGGSLKFALSKWFIWGQLYPGFYKKNKESYPEFSSKLINYDRMAALLVFPILYFYPWEFLLLALVPGLLFSWLIAFVFMYLPHRPHNISHAENPYRATIIREGWEWLLSPLMAYQNYHLVHHLYPTLPFYKYKKVWDAKKKFHMSHDPAIVKAFQLDP